METLVCYSLAIAAFAILSASAYDQCDTRGTLLYDELKCKRDSDKTSEVNCPTSYKCSQYQLSDKYCNFRGSKVDGGDHVSSELLEGTCDFSCHCNNNTEPKAKLMCAIGECAEYFSAPLEKDCYRTYDKHSCCSTGEKCPPFDDTLLCIVDGKEYKEGQKFTPKDTCLNCVCKKGFQEGNYDDTEICERRGCSTEIRHADKIEKNCAPLYYLYEGSRALCCPSDFICPDESIDVITPGNGDESTKDIKCKFGEKQLNYKDSFERKFRQYGAERTVKCVCDLPPYVTCSADY